MKLVLSYVFIFFVGFHVQAQAQKLFKSSFKEQNHELVEYYDPVNNIYSNYKYNIAFDGPNDWTKDQGLSKHTIYRTYQADSAITFSINIIELNENEDLKHDIWQFYQHNKEVIDETSINAIESQINRKLDDYYTEKTYIKNKVALKKRMKYLLREQDFEYYITSLSQQVLINRTMYTFGLELPTIFYEANKSYYDDLYLGISFLPETK